MFQEIRVYDLDGVLVDTSHRYRNKSDGTIDLDYWRENSHKVDADSLLPHAYQYRVDCRRADIYVILCTAREYHRRDVEFIERELGRPNKLIMRPVGDNTGDGILKRRQLSRLFNLKQFAKLPRFFFEDNLRNIEKCATLFSRCYYIPSHITGN